ncbi:MAG: hypothetical protein WC663_01430 [Patescibacteria group bacterium]|jgi:hypothetical protein
MTNPEIIKEQPEETKEFHFEDLAKIEVAMTSLSSQLKEKIDNQEYDTLISDEVGGRIPTLVLRKIIKTVNPYQDLKTYFLASGQLYFPRQGQMNYYELQKKLQIIAGKTKRTLLVTQFVFHGTTIKKMVTALKDSGIENLDVAAVESTGFEYQDKIKEVLGPNNQYVVGEVGGRSNLHEKHERFAGVRKTKKYSTFPKKANDVFQEEGREISEEEFNEIFGIKKDDSGKIIIEKTSNTEKIKTYERRKHEPLSEEEKQKIQQDINFAREDVDLLAGNIVKKVWKK